MKKMKERKGRTCVLAVLQAGMMALEILAFSATFPISKTSIEQPKTKAKKNPSYLQLQDCQGY